MGSYRQLTGMQDSPNRPDRLAPVPEHYQGTSLPYRGTETHGVPISKEAEYVPGDTVYNDADYHPEYLPDRDSEIPDPIPVRIVQGDSKRERLDWRQVRTLVRDVPQQILGRHEKRRSAIITVHDVKSDGETSNTDPIYIGHDSGLRPMTGFRIAAGQRMDGIHTTEDIWAVSEPGTEVEVSIYYEFGIEL